MKMISFIICLAGLILTIQSTTCFGSPEAAILELQNLLHAEEESRVKLTGDLVISLQAMQSVSAINPADESIDPDLQRHSTKIYDVKNNLLENNLRIEFLNSFISGLDRSGNGRNYAVALLIDLASRQLLSSVESGSENNIWLFEVYLSIALRDIMEPSENFAEFVSKYMAFSGLRDPRSPHDFLRLRKYVGGESEPQSPPQEQKLLDEKLEEENAKPPDGGI